MTPIDPDDIPADDADLDDSRDLPINREQDGVAALRDTEAESGDEAGLVDTYDMDDREARELGIDLDGRNEPEPRLD
jgi:hypothetical protein